MKRITLTANEAARRDLAEALSYRRLFPVDGMTIEMQATVWTAALLCDPIVLGGRLHYRIHFTSESGRADYLTAVFRASDLFMAPDYARWAVFFVKQWLAMPEPERKHQLFF